jgi:hypothetical protein
MSTKQEAQFAIGQTIRFAEVVGEGRNKKTVVQKWIITKYHQVMGKWEIMLRSEESGVHRSIPISELEEALRKSMVKAVNELEENLNPMTK